MLELFSGSCSPSGPRADFDTTRRALDRGQSGARTSMGAASERHIAIIAYPVLSAAAPMWGAVCGSASMMHHPRRPESRLKRRPSGAMK